MRTGGMRARDLMNSLMIRGLYLENGNRDQNLVCKIQWGSGLFPRYTISILELRYKSSRMEKEVFNHLHSRGHRRSMPSTDLGPWEACRISLGAGKIPSA